jgi:hypothetical protein
MPIKFTCPHCKKGLLVKDEMAGQKRACPACKQAVTIPNKPEGLSRPAGAAPSPPAAKTVDAKPAAEAGPFGPGRTQAGGPQEAGTRPQRRRNTAAGPRRR